MCKWRIEGTESNNVLVAESYDGEVRVVVDSFFLDENDDGEFALSFRVDVECKGESINVFEDRPEAFYTFGDIEKAKDHAEQLIIAYDRDSMLTNDDKAKRKLQEDHVSKLRYVRNIGGMSVTKCKSCGELVLIPCYKSSCICHNCLSVVENIDSIDNEVEDNEFDDINEDEE